MTIRFCLLLGVCVLCFGESLNAQILQGQVLDDVGAPVPYANVYLEELGNGAATDEQGNFSLRLSRGGDYRIIASAIGYLKSVDSILVEPLGVTLIKLTLKRDIALLEEVVVRAAKRDSGYIIMREVMDRRKEYLRETGAYRAEVYIKAREDVARRIKNGRRDSGSLDDLPRPGEAEPEALPGTGGKNKADSLAIDLNLLELRLRLNVAPPDQYKEERLGRSVYGSDDGLFVPIFGEADFNFYRARVDFGGLTKTTIISPLSPVAVLNYKFKLIETRWEAGDKVHEIEFKPRKRGNATAEGTLVINAGLYNIRSLEAELPKGSLRIFDELTIAQNYREVAEGTWLPVRQEFRYETRLGQRQRFRGTSTISYTNFELDYPFDPKFFGGEVAVTDQLAYERDSTYWLATRPEPLALDEAEKAYQSDSIRARRNSVEYKDSVEAAFNKITPLEIIWDGVGFQNHRRRERYFFGSLPSFISFEIIGGWRITPYASYFRRFPNEQSISTFAELSYGFQREDVLGNFNTRYRYNPRKLADATISGGRLYESIFPGDGIRNQLSRNNYILADKLAMSHRIELVNGLYLYTGGSYADRRPAPVIDSETFLSDLLEDEPPQEFEQYQAFVTEAHLDFTPHQRYLSEPNRKVVLGSNWPTFSLRHKRGWDGLFSSDIRFDYLEFAVEQRLELGAIGNTNYRAQLGQFVNTDDLRFVDLKRFRRADPLLFFEPLIGFQGLDTSLATTKPFLELHAIHHFNGALVNNIPLVKLLRIEAVAGGGILWLSEGDGYRHTEGFVGLERIFKLGARRRLRLGIYGVVSDARDRDVRWEPKFSIDVIDTWKRAWSF